LLVERIVKEEGIERTVGDQRLPLLFDGCHRAR
jgi:hypothetical protein